MFMLITLCRAADAVIANKREKVVQCASGLVNPFVRVWRHVWVHSVFTSPSNCEEASGEYSKETAWWLIRSQGKKGGNPDKNLSWPLCEVGSHLTGVSPYNNLRGERNTLWYGNVTQNYSKKKKNIQKMQIYPRGRLQQRAQDRARQLNPSPISYGSPLILMRRWRPAVHVPQPSLFHSLIFWPSPQYLPRCNAAVNYRRRAADEQCEGQKEGVKGLGRLRRSNWTLVSLNIGDEIG